MTSNVDAATTKTVLITGATRNIGLKFAERYIQNGWNVIGAARDLDKAEQLKALSPYKLVQLDTSDEASILRAAKELEGEPIDLLINNAGIFTSNGLNTITKEEMLQQYEVNAVGPFLITRAFVPNLKAAVAARGTATVAQISSILGSISSGYFPGFNIYAYRASKAALNMINAALAADLKSDGIATVALHPGYVVADPTGLEAQGAIGADTSIDALIPIISKASTENSGKFYSYSGDIISW